MSGGFEIGRARAAEAEALGQILSDWISETDWMPKLHEDAEDRAHVADLIGTGGVLVLRRDGRPLGYVFEEDGHLGAFYLAPEARGRGYGKKMLDRLKAENAALDLWTFAANRDARRFYEREGFREVERTPGDNPEGLPDVRMVWRRENEDE